MRTCLNAIMGSVARLDTTVALSAPSEKPEESMGKVRTTLRTTVSDASHDEDSLDVSLSVQWADWCKHRGMATIHYEVQERPVAPKRETDIRLLQWNILADGLSCDGFLTLPCVAKWPCDYSNLPTSEGESTLFQHAMTEMTSIKATGSKEEKSRKLSVFKDRYDTEFSRNNDDAVLAWRGRIIRMKQMIQHMLPDIICLQEVDHLAEFQEWLATQGYSCGREYVPMSVNCAPEDRLLESLQETGVAYAPHVNSTCAMLRLLQRYPLEAVVTGLEGMMRASPELRLSGVSVGTRKDLKSCVTNRSFQEAGGFKELLQQLSAFRCQLTPNCQKQPGHRGRCKDSPGEFVDDDAQVIFWRSDRFELERIEHLQFKLVPSSFAVKAVMKDLKASGRVLNVLTTHLKSGASQEEEKQRLERQILGPALAQGHQGEPVQKAVDGGLAEWIQSSSEDAATIVAMDSNSRPQFEAERTVWKVMKGLGGIRSVWSEYFDDVNDCKPLPVSVNKCRGPGSKQPEKVGSHAYELIDHVYYSSQLHLHGHALQPVCYENMDLARTDLIPSVQNPSDHLPVLVDFAYQ